jgi:hypothetical protein
MSAQEKTKTIKGQRKEKSLPLQSQEELEQDSSRYYKKNFLFRTNYMSEKSTMTVITRAVTTNDRENSPHKGRINKPRSKKFELG